MKPIQPCWMVSLAPHKTDLKVLSLSRYLSLSRQDMPGWTGRA